MHLAILLGMTTRAANSSEGLEDKGERAVNQMLKIIRNLVNPTEGDKLSIKSTARMRAI
jgi:hypothetical protein